MKVNNPGAPASGTVSPKVFAFLSTLPPEVLIDCYVQQLALNRGKCDSIVPLREVKADVAAMLALRGEPKAPTTRPEFYTYVVEFKVATVWVDDGFSLDDEDAADLLLADRLGYARADEVQARVLSAPTAEELRRDALLPEADEDDVGDYEEDADTEDAEDND